MRAILAARSARWGLRIARISGTSKPAEASRGICESSDNERQNTHYRKKSTYPKGHLLLAAILTDSESCEVSTSQERALSKRLYYVCIPPTLTLTGPLQAVCRTKIAWISEKNNISTKKIRFLTDFWTDFRQMGHFDPFYSLFWTFVIFFCWKVCLYLHSNANLSLFPP